MGVRYSSTGGKSRRHAGGEIVSWVSGLIRYPHAETFFDLECEIDANRLRGEHIGAVCLLSDLEAPISAAGPTMVVRVLGPVSVPFRRAALSLVFYSSGWRAAVRLYEGAAGLPRQGWYVFMNDRCILGLGYLCP